MSNAQYKEKKQCCVIRNIKEKVVRYYYCF
jgi:hypothetical protein